MKYKIFIADDHPIFRTGIKEVINKLPLATCIGEAENGLEAYKGIIQLMPDIAILDLDMPILSGLDVCKKVLNEKHFTKFMILTMHKEKHFFDDALDCGVLGYVLKDNAIEELVNCITTVGRGECYASPQIAALLTEHQALQQLVPEIKRKLNTLTPTEKIILKLIGQGSTSQEIAHNLFVSSNTIDNHRANIARKLELEGKNALVKFVIQHKE